MYRFRNYADESTNDTISDAIFRLKLPRIEKSSWQAQGHGTSKVGEQRL
jgi:hypothetical protein